MKLLSREGAWTLAAMAVGSALVVTPVVLLAWFGNGGMVPPAPSPTPSVAAGLTVAPIESADDCRPCERDARLTCCFPAHTVELDEASKRVLNFAFNLEGIVGEHDRLFQVAADRLRACDRRAADADARIAKLEDQVRDLALDVRELQRARKRRR